MRLPITNIIAIAFATSAAMTFAASTAITSPVASTSPPNTGTSATKTAFDITHDKAVAVNLPGVSSTFRTKDGRSTYYCGERIPTELVFTSAISDKYSCETESADRQDSDRLTGDRIFCDRVGNVPYIQDEFYIRDRPSGVQTMVKSKPYVMTQDVNEWVAFDQPGVYRVYAQNYRVYRKGENETNEKAIDYSLDHRHGRYLPPLTSTILHLTIIPAPPEWTAKVISDILKTISEENEMDQLKTLSYLRSPQAASAILKVMIKPPPQKYAGDLEFIRDLCLKSLVVFPHKEQITSLVAAAITDPNVPVPIELIDTYIRLLPGSDQSKRATLLLNQSLKDKLGDAKSVSEETAKAIQAKGY